MSEQVVQPGRIEINGEDGFALRQFVPEDANIIFGLIESDRGHLSQFGDDTAEKYPTVESVAESIANPKNPDRLRFGIWVDNQMVGSINLAPKDEEPEIGYWIGKEHTGHGYATKAVNLLSNYAFNHLGLDSLYAVVTVGNEASRRSLEKVGYVLVETFQGKSGPTWKYQLTKADINRLAP